jgi:hypothetical protein
VNNEVVQSSLDEGRQEMMDLNVNLLNTAYRVSTIQSPMCLSGPGEAVSLEDEPWYKQIACWSKKRPPRVRLPRILAEIL